MKTIEGVVGALEKVRETVGAVTIGLVKLNERVAKLEENNGKENSTKDSD